MSPHARLAVVLALVVGVWLAGCGSNTRLVTQWPAGGVDAAAVAGRALMVVPMADGARRRQSEDHLAAVWPLADGIPSYPRLPSPDGVPPHEAVLAAARATEATTVVVMRMVSDEVQVSEISATPYDMPGYWSRYYRRPYYYYPATREIRTRVIEIETTVYSVDDGSLVWSAVTRTRSPGGGTSSIDATVAAIAEAHAAD